MSGGEGLSYDMSPGHSPEKLELPLKGQREGLLASLWPRAAEKEAEMLLGHHPRAWFPFQHTSCSVSRHGVLRGHCCLQSPTHLF